MGLPTWKWFLLGSACGQPCSPSENCEDQTALLQSHLASHKSATLQTTTFPAVSQLLDPAARKTALVQLEATAVELAHTKQSDQGVSAVCGEVRDLLETAVKTLLQTGRDTDQSDLDTTYSSGTLAVNASYNEKKGLIDAFNIEAANYSNHSIECESLESDLCVKCEDCRLDCLTESDACEDWFTWVKGNYTKLLENTAVGATCEVEGSELTYVIGRSFEAENESHAQWDVEHHKALELAWSDYNFTYWNWKKCTDEQVSDCAKCYCPGDVVGEDGSLTDGLLYDFNSTWNEACPCQTLQEQYERCSLYDEDRLDWQCQHHNYGLHYQGSHESLHNQKFTLYTELELKVKIKEEDRKKEFETITHIICLLNLLIMNETDPTDEAYDGWVNETVNSTVIQACRIENVNTSHLNNEYYNFPEVRILPSVESPCSQTFSHTLHDCGALPPTVTTATGNCTCETYQNVTGQVAPKPFPEAWGPFLTLNPYLATGAFDVEDNNWGYFQAPGVIAFSGKIVGLTGEIGDVGFAFPAIQDITQQTSSPIYGLLSLGALVTRTGPHDYELKQLTPVPPASIVIHNVPLEDRLLLEKSETGPSCPAELDFEDYLPDTVGAGAATGWRWCQQSNGLSIFEFKSGTTLITFLEVGQ